MARHLRVGAYSRMDATAWTFAASSISGARARAPLHNRSWREVRKNSPLIRRARVMRAALSHEMRRWALLILAGASALASTIAAQAGERAHLAQNQSPISGVSIVALRNCFFAKNGLEVEVSNFTTGKQCLDTVMGGAADIATTAEAPTTAAAMAGQKIAFLARTEYSYIKTLTAAAAGIGKFGDLRGKRVAYT